MSIKEASEIIGEEEPIEVIFESVPIPIYFKVKMRIRSLQDEVERLKERIDVLEKSETAFLIEISDEIAEKEIKGIIAEIKKRGEKVIDDIEIIKKLNIPIEQVDRIFNKLTKEGIVVERK